MINGKRLLCNVPLRWILLNFLSLSACFKRERESQNGEKIISFYKGWEIDVGPRSDWLTRRSPKFRTETTAKHPIQQMSERKESFQDLFNRIPVRFKDILLWQRPTTKREACCYLWEASSFSQETKSVLRSVCFTAVAVVSTWNIWMQIE